MTCRPVIFLLIYLITAGCGSATPTERTQAHVVDQPTPVAELEATNAPVIWQHTPLPQVPAVINTVPGTTASIPAEVNYRFNIIFDYPRRRLEVSETVEYTHHADTLLPDLVMIVDPARKIGIFQLNSCSLLSGAAGPCRLDGALLKVSLEKPLKPDTRITISITYELALPGKPSTLGYTQRQTNLIDWYPFFPPYSPASGWIVREPGAVGEYLIYEMGDYEIDLTITNRPAGLKIAASASPVSDGSHYLFRMKHGRSFAWSASPEYQILEEQAGRVKISSYYFSGHQNAAEAGIKSAAEALKLYSDMFVTYPHTSLAIVEAEFFDGMEDDGLFFLGTEYYLEYNHSQRSYMTALSAHETAHLWWYALVASDHALEPWVDEALATFCELIYYQHKLPELVKWWWDFRVNRFSPGGWVNSTVYEHQNFRPYVNAVYLQGAVFLNELRSLMGQEVFMLALREYSVEYSGKIGGADSLMEKFRNYSQVDLQPLLNRYFKKR
jgi:hypothetical protein